MEDFAPVMYLGHPDEHIEIFFWKTRGREGKGEPANKGISSFCKKDQYEGNIFFSDNGVR